MENNGVRFDEPRLVEGASFPVSVMELRRLHVRSYDKTDDMVTLSIEDLMLYVFDRQKLKPVSEVVIVFEIVRLTLKSMNAGGSCSRGWIENIGVAGSSALLVLEAILRRDKDLDIRGRWTEDLNKWQSGDVDVFVGGRWGSSEANFFRCARRFLRHVKLVGKSKGHAFECVEHYYHRYAFPNTRIKIVDIHLADLNVNISLVQTPNNRNMKDVIDSFDIDVAKVIYNPTTGLLHAPLSTLAGVDSGNASVKCFEMDKDFPSEFQVRNASSSLRRMRKYGQRGYAFSEYMSFSMSE